MQSFEEPWVPRIRDAEAAAYILCYRPIGALHNFDFRFPVSGLNENEAKDVQCFIMAEGTKK